jgi:two-component system NarL family response regulator
MTGGKCVLETFDREAHLLSTIGGYREVAAEPPTDVRTRYRVILADDHPLVRLGLRHVLQQHFDVIAEVSRGVEAVDQALARKPDVVMLDVNMPGMSGLVAAKEIHALLPSIGLVILSAFDADDTLFGAIEAGASSFIPKDAEPDTIIEAVNRAAQGQAYLPSDVATRVLENVAAGPQDLKRNAQRGSGLTARELEVLRLIGQGAGNQGIADSLVVSIRTVGNHISSIYQKLGIDNRHAAMLYAIKNGVVRV